MICRRVYTLVRSNAAFVGSIFTAVICTSVYTSVYINTVLVDRNKPFVSICARFYTLVRLTAAEGDGRPVLMRTKVYPRTYHCCHGKGE